MAAGNSIIPPFPEDVDREAFGHWLSGFTDGEGSFLLFWHTSTSVTNGRRRRGQPVGTARFTLGLRDDDRPILDLIQSFWGCGQIGLRHQRSGRPNVKPASALNIGRLIDLATTVVPHFDRFPLRAKKANDFAIWKEGVEMLHRIKQRKHEIRLGYSGNGRLPKWTAKELSKFKALHDSLREIRRFSLVKPACVKPLPDCSEDQLTLW